MPGQKAAWSIAAAQALLAHSGEQTTTVAGEVALLFEAARDWWQAAAYFLQAAQHAVGMAATHEAAGLARRGLVALQKSPDTPARARLELQLQIALGTQVQAAKGFAAAELETVFTRARVLCQDRLGIPEIDLAGTTSEENEYACLGRGLVVRQTQSNPC